MIIVLIIILGCKGRAIRDELNKQSGYISPNMRRVVMTPRSDPNQRAMKNGIYYGDEDANKWGTCESDQYWNEEG